MKFVLTILIFLVSLSASAIDWLPEIQGLREQSFRNPSEAITSAKKEARLQPHKTDIYIILQAESHILREDAASSLDLLYSISDSFPKNNVDLNLWFYTIFWYSLSYQEVDLQGTTAALDKYYSLSKNDNLKAYSLFLQSMIENIFGEKSRAIELIENTLKLNPHETLFHRTSLFLLTINADVYMEGDLSKYSEAINFYENKGYTLLLEIAYYNRALLHRRASNYDASTNDFLRSARISKKQNSINAYNYAIYHVARNYFHLGDYYRAEQTIESIQKDVLAGHDHFLQQEFLLQATFIHWNRFNREKAQFYFKKLNEIGTDLIDQAKMPELLEVKALLANDDKDRKAFDFLKQAFDLYRANHLKEVKEQYLQRQIQANLLQESRRNENLSNTNLQQQETLQRLIVSISMLLVALGIAVALYLFAKQKARMEAVSNDNFKLTTEKKLLEKEILEERLDEANLLQRALVSIGHPETLPSYIEYETFYEPAEKAGGDWYGVFHDEGNEILYLIIGDVTGHSLGASLVTAAIAGTAQACFEYISKVKLPPDQGIKYFLDNANSMLLKTSRSEILMTMQIMSIDLRSFEAWVCNGGHNPFRFLQRKENVKHVTIKPSSILGLDEKLDINIMKMQLYPGDIILFFTDGLIENGSSTNAISLRKLVKQFPDEPSLLNSYSYIVDSYRNAIEGSSPADDCCFIIVKLDKPYSRKETA